MSDERLRTLRKTLFWEILKQIAYFDFKNLNDNDNRDAPNEMAGSVSLWATIMMS